MLCFLEPFRRHKQRSAVGVDLCPLESRLLLSSTMLARPLDALSPADLAAGGSATVVGYTPTQIADAYGVDAIRFGRVVGDGTGQTIALITAYDNPDLLDSTDPNFDNSDLHQFDLALGLPDPPSFTKVNQTGGSTAGLPPDPYWANEADLDVEWAHALAPQADLLLVECDDDTLDNLIGAGANYARQQPGVSVVSMSFTSPEAAAETQYDATLTTPAGHAGVTFVAGTGDSGAPGAYPAYSPNVLAVGDTTLTLSGNTYVAETGYAGSGGGISQFEPKPAFQDELATPSLTFRTIPDAAFTGDSSNGAAVYDSYNGSAATPWYEEGGTSFATPTWGALIAIADQGRATEGLASLDGPSQTLPELYGLNAGDFHDITTGNNGFAAGSGYDLVTGRGTPVANLLVPDLAGGNGSIEGSVFDDAAGTGVRTINDRLLSGRTVYLDRDGSGTLSPADLSATTNAQGVFSFTNLPAGTYTVLQVVPAGFDATAPAAPYVITVAGGTAYSGVVFATQGTVSPAGATGIGGAAMIVGGPPTASAVSPGLLSAAENSPVPLPVHRLIAPLPASPMDTPAPPAPPAPLLWPPDGFGNADANSLWWQQLDPSFLLREPSPTSPAAGLL